MAIDTTTLLLDIQKQIAVLQEEFKEMKSDIKEMKSDVKLLATLNQLDQIKKEPRLRALYNNNEDLKEG